LKSAEQNIEVPRISNNMI